ncbi:MAG: M23 family metallopeptidase [Gemmatimonadaceae bacterium]
MKHLRAGLLLALPCACTALPSDDKVVIAPDTVVVVVPAPVETLIVSPFPDSLALPLPLPVPVPDSAPAPDSLSLMVPVQGINAWDLRDTFGDPRTGHMHEALDIMAPRGTPVLSATGGRLTKLYNSKQGGTMVYAADSTDRFILMYGHLDRYADGLIEGMPLVRGQLLGYVGSTGAAVSAPHLHFAIARGKPSVAWWKGEAVNPYPLLFRPR